MKPRSNSTTFRDHERALRHRAWLEIQELSTIDWESVDESELQEIIDSLEDLESELDDYRMCEQIRNLLNSIEEYLG